MKREYPLRFGIPMGGKPLRYCAIAIILLAAFSGAFSSSTTYLFCSPQSHVALADRGPIIEPEQDQTRQALSIAEAQHEKVRVLISQGRFDRVLPEVKTILDLKLPEKFESSVAQSACIIADDLAEKSQFALAHDVLEEALRRMKLNENKVSILKIEAFVYKTEGNLDKALQYLEKAIDLEKQRIRP